MLKLQLVRLSGDELLSTIVFILKCKVFILLVGLNVLFLHFSALDKYIVSPFA